MLILSMVMFFLLAHNKPIEYKHYGQKNGEVEGVE